jgi:hypothetical protein
MCVCAWQFFKLVLILIMVVFIAVITLLAVSWLVAAVLATAHAWLAGAAASCVTTCLFFHQRWQGVRGPLSGAGSRADRRDLERAFDPTAAAWLSSLAGSALAVIVIAGELHESAPAMTAYYLLGVGLTVAASRCAVPLLRRLYLWHAERWLRRLGPPEQETRYERAPPPGENGCDALAAAYAILQTDRAADDSTITLQYRKLVREFHPDHSQQATPAVRALAEERMKQINRALDEVMRSRAGAG